MTVTATQRRPPARRCTLIMSGQVATTIMIAQMIAPRNGRRIQSEAAISPPITITVSRMRVSSRPWSSATRRGRQPDGAGLRVRPFWKPAWYASGLNISPQMYS